VAVSGTRSAAGRPAFLPNAIESGLRAGLSRLAGASLMLLCACAWLSLVSWSANDPALTSSSGTPYNFLGTAGASAADWMLQCLGFAAAIALFAPTTWAAELLAGHALPSRHHRFFLWPMSSILMAGALAAIPAPSSWPLGHGLGGLFGDRLNAACSSLLATAGIGANPLIAGLALGLVAACMTVPLLGIPSLSRQRADHDAIDAGPQLPMGTGAWRDDRDDDMPEFDRSDLLVVTPDLSTKPESKPKSRLSVRKGQTPALALTPSDDIERSEPDWQQEEPLLAAGWMADADAEPVVSEHYARDWAAASPVSGAPYSPDRVALANNVAKPARPLHVPYAQDYTTEFAEPADDSADDDGSSHIARRFAPGRTDSLDDEIPNTGAIGWRRWRKSGTERPDAPPTLPEPAPFSAQAVEPAGPGALAAGRPSRPAKAAPLAVASPPETQGYRLPSTKLLSAGQTIRPGADLQPMALKLRAKQLEDVLSEFGIKGRIGAVRPGPVVTLFELEPAPGLKTGRVVGLADDIARSMSAKSARIAAVPGRNVIGIELPNELRQTVYLRDIMESEAFKRSTASLPIIIGKAIEGEPVIADLARMPHLLIAGTTGSGKSVGVNAMILSLLFRFTPEQCRMILIDPKVLELSAYSDIPHLLTPIVTDAKKAVAALGWAVSEMEERYKRMAQMNVRSIDTFNNALHNAQRQGSAIKRTVQTGFDRTTGRAIYEDETLNFEPMPYIVIVIDEMADLMLTAGKEFEVHVQRLAQKARAAGIHLITATQRPSVDVVTGVIKANLPARLSYRVASKIDSRTVLNEQGAEHLLGAGDLLFNPGSGAMRAHGPFVADEDVNLVAAELRRNGAPAYVDAVTAAADAPAEPTDTADDELFRDAVQIVTEERKATISQLQRRLSIGYNKAAGLIERLEAEGMIGPAAAGKRPVLVVTNRSA
jgi:DNA segregation ATPase FtsK/SpoIIIE, S-DNA-T family